MAVTIISSPLNLAINTVSNGFEYILTDDLLAQDNFRYTFEISINAVIVGTKKVVSTGTNTTIDLSETIKQYISQSTTLNGSDIWDIIDIENDPDNPSMITLDVVVGDQYELAGAIISSSLPSVQYASTRGAASGFDYDHASRFRDVGQGFANNIMRVVRGEDMFSSYILAIDSGLTVSIDYVYYDKNGVQITQGTTSKVMTVTGVGSFMVYFPVGTSNAIVPIADTIYRATYLIYTNAPIDPSVFIDTRIYDQCYENPVTLMFKDTYFQWSQFTFDAINSEGIDKTRDQWESQFDGMRDFNVKGRTSLTLNSSYMSQDESADIERMFMSDEIYIIPSGERVTMEMSSLPIKTRQKEKVINYTFRVKKSARLFKP